MTIGIYCIENKISGHKYIGQSSNIEKRWREHVWCLNAGTHDNKYLQCSWDISGADIFSFSVLEECELNDLSDREIYHIAILHTKHPEGYNQTDGGDTSVGFRHSQETKDRISALNIGRKMSEETNLKHSMTNKADFARTGRGTRLSKKNTNATSKYLGVSWNTRMSMWKVDFQIKGKSVFLGYFESETEAAALLGGR